jgi:pimeloyl-ACP methyl ester carboxylesterase
VTDLAVDVFGEGETVVLVHGSGVRDWTWRDQWELADRYRLVMPYRRGYGDGLPADPDFERDGEDVAELLEEPAHLVGFSYGGIGVLLAAARRPELVRSMTVVEPPAFGLARGNEAVEELIARVEAVYARAPELSPAQFGIEFGEALGFDRPPPTDPAILSALEAFKRERPPWEAEIPFERIERIRALVVSGGWSAAFDAVCEELTRRLLAEPVTFEGAGHGAQHAPGFNERLVSFWETCAR